MREFIRRWRFYDHFRSDADAPVRQPQLGTRTPVLHHDGRDLAAALQTILEIGDVEALHTAISDAFPGTRLHIEKLQGGRFAIAFQQHGLLRPLSAAELSDGTLRYLLLVAALLHTTTALADGAQRTGSRACTPICCRPWRRLIIRASVNCQVWVVSHATRPDRRPGAEMRVAIASCWKRSLGRPGLSGSGCWMSRRGDWPD